MVANDLKELVKLRNQAAVQLGFKNYHALQLYLNEQDGERADQAVRRAGRIDARCRSSKPRPTSTPGWRGSTASRPATCRPWHYHDPFFQETPAVFKADLDAPFAKADLLQMCREVLRRHRPADRRRDRRTATCYEKKGKSPHAFCTDIDRDGDVRVLANIKPNDYWAVDHAARVRPFGLLAARTSRTSCPTCCAAKRTSSPPRAWP